MSEQLAGQLSTAVVGLLIVGAIVALAWFGRKKG
jgi:hypothetical protein